MFKILMLAFNFMQVYDPCLDNYYKIVHCFMFLLKLTYRFQTHRRSVDTYFLHVLPPELH